MHLVHAALLTLALPAAAQDLLLVPPLDCTLGEDCDIQQYVDADPGPGAADFTGGPLSYDGHAGTDFRVADLEAMAAGIPVRAPADGVVRGARDGMADRAIADRAEVEGRECGNGVALDHGGGWVTQLCHMAEGSVTVAPGDRVAAGDVLGEVGLSGATQFPHVHLQVTRDGETVDPFVPGTGAAWAEPVPYAPGGLLGAGFADAVPEYDAVKAGTADASALPLDAPALVLWGHAFGGRAGDEMRLTVIGPTGREVLATTVALERTQAELFRAVGRRLRAARWRGGDYVGTVELLRDGTVIDRVEARVTLG
ncbi:M23 family metallopeptidase [Jannaschia sp. Os4]|uniref:M23 family metallopeptidase n=1 Tax=Jannaschia sp. Os4 TaxID=2807617 RepID=UPI0019397C66|nr:M23 family metallopeptidase [Jannaschia sp. Os4]MBM2576168.1 M23 family metallopeptidase [Jannaschia sp. Os4]